METIQQHVPKSEDCSFSLALIPYRHVSRRRKCHFLSDVAVPCVEIWIWLVDYDQETAAQARSDYASVWYSDPAILNRRGDTLLAATSERMIFKKMKVMEFPNFVNSMLQGFHFGCSVLEKVIEETRYRLHYVHGATIV